ncbi:MAG: NADH-quinone oxidoreductase subunit NuoN [Gammaproteobacteria bacterium]|nr:NADH-quinone oxidoreductase subunit NuoN [Gammaproteobacteria bacterium]
MNLLTQSYPDLVPAVPELFVLTMACIILLLDLVLSVRWRNASFLLTLYTLLGASLLTLQDIGEAGRYTFNGMFVDDLLSDVLKVGTYLLVACVLVYSRRYMLERKLFRGEYFVLVLFGVLGMMVLASASHMLTLYMGLELMALSLYTLVALQRDSRTAIEAAMKYFVLGALASGMLLYGISMLYGVTGTLDIAGVAAGVRAKGVDNLTLGFAVVFVIVGIGFKLGAVPFHMWVPDVYEGAPTSVTLYIATAPKLAAFAIIMRLLVGGLVDMAGMWQDMLILLAVVSIALGNVVAISQSNIKRMLAYSTIAHMGFLLLGIIANSENGFGSAMFYALVYSFMSLGAFGVILLLSDQGFEADKLEDFRGLNRRSRWLALLMLILMFSMAGIPPTAGFFAKMAVIQAVIEAGQVWLAVVAVLFAVVGAYYYLRVVKLMYFDDPDQQRDITAGWDARLLLAGNALALVLVLPWIGALLDLCAAAIRAIPALP